MLNKKGFLGPIGDDLPSLIPLLLALIIFLSTFTFTFNTFSSRSMSFESDLDALAVAHTLKASSYINGIDDFHALCGSITVRNVNYSAGLTDAMTNPNSPAAGKIDIFNPQFVTEQIGWDTFPYECKNADLTIASAEGRTVLTRVYPVALEQDRRIKPVHLVVAVWK